mmetsp:Transcript_20032/g.30698  ORF Transcript_20032/g.30698 Transcript_20032/m.30698 type:complete len:303 (-) Transcript_20032:1469-2377(-)
MSMNDAAADQKSPTTNYHLHPINTPTDILQCEFEKDGFICLSSLIDKEGASHIRAGAEQSLQDCWTILHANGHTKFPHEYRTLVATNDDDKNGGPGTAKEYALGRGVKHGFKEIVMRHYGRYEMTYKCDQQNLISSIDDCCCSPYLANVLDSIFHNEKYYMCSMSIVMASAGAAEQQWHQDGPHLDIARHQPCHCLNVFIPLMDVTLCHGPTELRPGTHYYTRNLASMMLAARAKKTLRDPVLPLLHAGDALIFDYRVLHRGRANLSDEDRPILVMTFAKSWFSDVLNFPKRSMFDVQRSEA